MSDMEQYALPPEIDAALDESLARWAAASALPPAQVAAVRERILAADASWQPALDAGWWQWLGASIGRTIARSTQVALLLGQIPAAGGTLARASTSR